MEEYEDSRLLGPLIDVLFFILLLAGALLGSMFAVITLPWPAFQEMIQSSSDTYTGPVVPPSVPAFALALFVFLVSVAGMIAFPAWSRLRGEAHDAGALLLRLFAFVMSILGFGLVLVLGLLLALGRGLQPMAEAGEPDVPHLMLLLAGIGPILFALVCLRALPGYLRSLSQPAPDARLRTEPPFA